MNLAKTDKFHCMYLHRVDAKFQIVLRRLLISSEISTASFVRIDVVLHLVRSITSKDQLDVTNVSSNSVTG